MNNIDKNKNFDKTVINCEISSYGRNLAIPYN